jgi:hypothetical protein
LHLSKLSCLSDSRPGERQNISSSIDVAYALLCFAYAQLLTKFSYSSNENARLSNKKTISPQDVMSALKDAELEEFLPRLEAELKSEPFS